MKKKCKAKNAAGKPCGASALRDGSGFCYFHSPQFEQGRQAARIKGGKNRRVHRISEPVKFTDEQQKDPAAVLRLVWVTIAETRALENGVQRNRCLTQLFGQALKAQEAADLDARLRALEERIA